MKKGDKVICSIFGEEIGKVYYVDQSTGIVDIKYKGHNGVFSAHKSLIIKVWQN